MLLHELGHVDAHHGVLGVEQELGQRLAQLCLAHPGRAEEQEGADGPVRIGQPGPGAANGVGDGVHRLFLADHPAVQLIFHPQQLVALPFQHPRHRNTGPARQHVCDLHVGDPVAQQAGLLHLRLGGEIQLFLQLGDAAILQLGHAAEIPGTAGHLEILAGLLQRSLDVLGTGKGGLLGLPHLFQLVVFPLLLGQLLVEQIEPLAAGVVVLLHQRLLLQLELDDAPLEAVQGFRLGVDLQPYAGRRLVDEVDGLVRQLAIRDVAVGQLGRRNYGGVCDLHMVVQLVAFFKAAQYGDGVLHRGLLHQHLLEAALQGGILLHILPIFIERGGADAVQLTPRQGGFEHVARIHGPLALAGADHGVQLVHEEDDVALLLGEIAQHRLEPLLELAAILGTGHQGPHVQRQHPLVLEPFRHLAVDDALGQPLDDGGLADAGGADQHRVILGTALQHLDGTADLFIPADHRVEFAEFGPLGQIDGVLLQRLAVLLGVGIIDLLAATHLVDGRFQFLLGKTLGAQQLPQVALLVEGCQYEQLGRDELILALLGQLVTDVKQTTEAVGKLHIPLDAAHLGQAVELLAETGAQGVDVHPGQGQQRTDGAAILIEQCRHQMDGFDELVVTTQCERLGIGNSDLEFAGQAIEAHCTPPLKQTRRLRGKQHNFLR
ncbi:hypothetical protein D3C71_1092560 [compost metagenome]